MIKNYDSGFHYTKAQLSAFPDPVEAFKRRGAHWTFDGSSFVSCLKKLKENGKFSFPSFDHGVGDPVNNDINVNENHHVVIIEGNYLLLNEQPWSEIKNILDFCYFIDVDIETVEKRVFSRHCKYYSEELSMQKVFFLFLFFFCQIVCFLILINYLLKVTYNDSPNAKLILETKNFANKIIKSL